MKEENRFRCFAVLMYLALAVFSMRSFIFTGRFWGEDSIFYVALSGKEFYQIFTHTFNGHLELITNFVVYLSTLVGLYHAPLVTTLVSFAIQTLPILLVIFNREMLGLSKKATLLFIVLLLGSPGAAEVAANSVNLHFHFALLTIVILFLPVTRFNNFLLLISGLSGIPANAVAPFYLYLARLEKSRDRMFQFFILAATSVLQIYLLLTHKAEIHGREFDFSPFYVLQVFLNQEVVLPLTQYPITEKVCEILRSEFSVVTFGLYALLIAIFGGVVYAAFQNQRTRFLIIINLFLGYFFCITAHLGSLERLDSLSGGRYFYPVFATIIMILLYWLDRYRNILLRLGLTLLFLVSLTRIYHQAHTGPAWDKAYSEGIEKRSINIWPTGFKINLP